MTHSTEYDAEAAATRADTAAEAARQRNDAERCCAPVAPGIARTLRPAPTWTLQAGRCICRDGVPQFELHKVPKRDGSGEYTVDPTEMDSYARLVCNLLQQRFTAPDGSRAT